MYIKKLVYENVGPIEQITITPSFTSDERPKPLLLVGENGSGKSTVLSNIVDSLYEIAGMAFENACQPSGSSGHQFYKAVRPADIHTGKDSMFSFIQFQENDLDFLYICKSGNLTRDSVQEKLHYEDLSTLSWKEDGNYKETNVDSKKAQIIYENNVICYFGPDRYEKPAWLGDKYFETINSLHPKVQNYFSGHLYNDITVKNVTATNLQWLLDIIADSRADIKISTPNTGNELLIRDYDYNKLLVLNKARNNLEAIMSKILGEEIYFGLNLRNSGGSRFRILRSSDNSVIAPSLDALSTGQIALFNTFATIIRYADSNDIYQSIEFSNIRGIVVIDEIELHLHTKLQKEVLPELIKLFPRIQFIITTHAPLFLLGMAETFGEENFDIYELPSATKITVERFTEFQKAFKYFQETQQYQELINTSVQKASTGAKTLVITEGSTDWKHMKAAYQSLKSDCKYSDLFENLDFSFFEYEPDNSSLDAQYKLQMGNSVLEALCENYSKLPQTTRYIFIADRDNKVTNKKLSEPNVDFKSWGNNVFSFILPLPPSRNNTPEICIEHLYSNDEIKTEYLDPESGISRRLYIGNEFDIRGVAKDIDRICERNKICGPDSIAIIEGSTGERVTAINGDPNVNLALPKSKFASLVLSKQAPFDHFDFSNFIKIFEIIKQIIET